MNVFDSSSGESYFALEDREGGRVKMSVSMLWEGLLLLFLLDGVE